MDPTGAIGSKVNRRLRAALRGIQCRSPGIGMCSERVSQRQDVSCGVGLVKLIIRRGEAPARITDEHKTAAAPKRLVRQHRQQ
jgi:hypothetical protein